MSRDATGLPPDAFLTTLTGLAFAHGFWLVAQGAVSIELTLSTKCSYAIVVAPTGVTRSTGRRSRGSRSGLET